MNLQLKPAFKRFGNAKFLDTPYSQHNYASENNNSIR